ncbi:MAG: antibiotic synthesis protein MbtH [Geobacteraceae bacterium GWB2_52_12]|nr:MAG: antibiotic synthesis protein MbtH [Geobacteraceae bacterium GWB2_52_12]
MQTNEGIDNEEFDVVINDEQQYSIWPRGKEVPAGWQKVGITGSRVYCLEHISSIWTDMRPLSLRSHTKIS